MIRPALFAACLACMAAGPLGDPAADVIPRTPDEAARVRAVTALPADPGAPQPFESLPGGAATSLAHITRDVLSQPSANMGFAGQLEFKVGDGIFKKNWVSAPSSTTASDGLGPLYNARACQLCHLKDGRGHPPEGADDASPSLLLRLSVPGPAGLGPDPVYGDQIQDLAIPGHTAEGRVAVTWTDLPPITLGGGEQVTLRAPAWRLDAPGYGPLPPGAVLSARIAPPMTGLGLLEAIPAADILALADPDDANGDGIRGRAAMVDSAAFGRPMPGRFGWKAAQPTLIDQTAGAALNDMGLSTPQHPDGAGACTPGQSACRAAPDGGEPVEIGDPALTALVYYARNLAVPARRDPAAPQVLAGKAAFHAAGCPACHRPSFVTDRLADRPEQSFQLIWPYTDLLLHDMGPGLADNRPEGAATGMEWRTPPLWGIGLTETVSGHTRFLHDGRARTLLEAILWHGGEASRARDAVVAMDPETRAALLRFVGSL